MRMANYRANPEEAHKEFQKCIDNIASSVSADDVRKVTTILKVTDELGNHYGDLLSKTMNAQTKEFWINMGLDKKLEQLNLMEKENLECAKPETDMSDIESIEGIHWHKQVRMLEKNIDKVMKETAQIQSKLNAYRIELQNQLDEITKHNS